MLPDAALGARPELNSAKNGFFIGRDASSRRLEARWTGGGPFHMMNFELIASQAPSGIIPQLLEDNDTVVETSNSISVASNISGGWDGVDVTLTDESDMGLACSQDGLASPQLVTPYSNGLGPLNAYRLPKAEPYGTPVFKLARDQGLFLWKDRSHAKMWHLRGTTGSRDQYRRYAGRILSNMPVESVQAFGLESGDLLDLSNPKRIVFDFHITGRALDGVDFRFPAEARVELIVDDPADGYNTLHVGEHMWPVEGMPVDLSGW